ncbi:receptor-type tyrosine-protein phosphatase mu-like [Mizuhopecten yessoensis]|uniref:receptor-type tyrosine-protein phosphatase mu-like n=1 Tax=Mizuhopecten yessoensis TaxID=6573 RepID=UPI000B45AFD0|nr:receptor-type tyrosine-protein phosphatase mu-like [Mizuhopecten yessoensis]
MARCAEVLPTAFVIILLSIFPGSRMSINLKSQLTLDATSSSPYYPVSTTKDGKYGPFSSYVCMASYGAKMVWWRGTFPSKARIHRIDIVFRGPDRADGFALWVSNDTGIPSGIKCYEDVDAGFPNVTQNITSCNRTGRRVMIIITRTAPTLAYMDVCEVDVYGCFKHKYGDQCQYNCANCKHGCDPDNGVCDSTHCNAGWTGPRYCNQTCSSVTFGENCVEECHCKMPVCNGVTGLCQTPGCQAGYHGTSCSQVCSNTTFGENCSSKCHCDDPGCDSVTGHCNVPGCGAGWKGKSCNIPCAEGMFGKDCNTRCHCAVPGCDKADGTCTDTSAGCLDGWNGSSCSQACVAPYFGNKCTSQCRCKTFGCNHVYGTCAIPGCISGWMGTSCSTQCPANMFGEDCLLTCHCNTPGCSRLHGTCFSSDGCSDGYIGSSCSTKCISGHFGANCTNQCRCKDAACSHVTGNCSASGCLPGWRGDTCSERCLNSSYGQDCMFTCGQCFNMTVCNHENGQCKEGCMNGYYGNSCHSDQPISDKDVTGSDTGGTVGGVIGACLIAVVVIGIIILLKRRQQAESENSPKYKPNTRLFIKDTGMHECLPEEENNDSVQKPKNLNKDKERTSMKSPGLKDIDIDDEENMYANSGGNFSDVYESFPIPVKKFGAVLELKEAGELLDKEYQTLRSGAVHPHVEGKKEYNIPKNRFNSIFPYDHSRVILEDQKSEPGSDYINANYIDDSTSRSKVYIAVQGPKKKFFEAFWLMIWQQKCQTIAMLANLYENGKNKCYKYWPNMDDPITTATFVINLNSEKQYAFYVIRVITLKHRHKGKVRQIHQFHYTKWPDHDIPDVLELVMFHRHLQRLRTKGEGPLIAHCSAGIGRTGTLIALDALLEAGKTADVIDIHGYVTIMRNNRMNMVQTVNQYKALHQALLEGLNFPYSLQTKTDFISSEESDIYEVPVNHTQRNKEFQTLKDVNAISEKRLEYVSAKSTENWNKNRDMDILPDDNYRVVLYSDISQRNNYINAIKLPSFRHHLRYLVTQFPLKHTIVDFWTMVSEYRSSTIVCLEDSVGEKEIPWWPEKSRVKYVAPFEIRSMSVERCEDSINASMLEIKNKQSNSNQRVKLFRVSNWENDSSIPSSQTVLCKLHYLVEAWMMSREQGPIVVTCLDGAKRCGLYCLISTTLERLDMESDIDLYATTRQLQIRRPQLVASMDQYKYTWTAVKAYLQTMGNSYDQEYQHEEAVYQNNP